ncbi:MAG: methionine--tRNA ligase [Phycisphaeraceae bacterium]|nr:methionine--tRNA ligase [Phycisphaeraceae bacterium]
MTASCYYVTTPIYYVNDKAHIGHVYTTTVADVLARFHRLRGVRTFFLTGTDEHAAKVVDSARERGRSPQDWADENAGAFQETFDRLGMTHDDFIRTSQERHKSRVTRYVQALMAGGDVYPGEYEGWYDAGQEEYVPESKAKEFDYKSPINGKPLVRKREKNYFFRLSAYGDQLLSWMESNPRAVLPEARRNEVLGRIREGLNDVPISRSGQEDWGIAVPGDSGQTIYVWIDALMNYLTTIDTDERREFWPCDVHLIGKDILWFHAVIWPAILMALNRRPGYEWVTTPRSVYAHSFWISEGMKMSKSLGNFIDLPKLEEYIADFGLDAVRFYLATQGPLGATDSDFAHQRFAEIYNTALANTLGNSLNRVCNMSGRYADGLLPPVDTAVADVAIGQVIGKLKSNAGERTKSGISAYEQVELHIAADAALALVRDVDSAIEQVQPFKLAKDAARLDDVKVFLAACAEALRIGSLLLWPILPGKIEAAWRRLGCGDYAKHLENRGLGQLEAWTRWGAQVGPRQLEAGDPLFPRHQEK